MLSAFAVVLAGLLTAGAEGEPASAGPLKFEILSTVLVFGPDGDPATTRGLPCFYGAQPPDIPVVLLSETDPRTCRVKTGKVGPHWYDGECTTLLGAESCGKEFTLAVIGGSGKYRWAAPEPVKEANSRAALLQAIKQGGVAEAASKRWKDVKGPLSFEPEVEEALTWPALEGSPTLVRLKVKGEPETGGPWVAFLRGKPDVVIGPFTTGRPIGFILDGRSYLRIDTAGCYGCGAVGTEVHVIEGGKLRRVALSSPNAT